MREQYGDGLLWGRAGKGPGNVVAPELEAHEADSGGGDSVGNAGGFNVEGTDGKVGGLGGRGNEGLEGVGWGVVFPIKGLECIRR